MCDTPWLKLVGYDENRKIVHSIELKDNAAELYEKLGTDLLEGYSIDPPEAIYLLLSQGSLHPEKAHELYRFNWIIEPVTLNF